MVPLAWREANLFDQQLLGHGDTLVEALLVALQHALLLIYLPPEVTVRLQRSTSR